MGCTAPSDGLQASRHSGDAVLSLLPRCTSEAVLTYDTLLHGGLFRFGLATVISEPPPTLSPRDVDDGEHPAAHARGEATPHARDGTSGYLCPSPPEVEELGAQLT